MGLLLDMELVAEGVEEVEQLAILKSFGCNYYQGYLSSQAVPLAEFEVILQNDEKAGA
jgi:EAL domain-containing protein (putative c-di-GMP-specific phosphodiesterase class I)